MEHTSGDLPRSRVSDNGLAALQDLLACDAVNFDVLFGFDVRHSSYVADLPALLFAMLPLRGPLLPDIYHELKDAQFILEYDAVSRPDYRYFALTEAGRRMKEGRSP